jgi:molybdenum cofactor cytidylyltransferase
LTGTRTVVAVVLAAGSSTRFGGDKLLQPLAGKPLAAHVADTLAGMGLSRIAVCPAGDATRAALFAARGFEVVANPDPGRGMGASLGLGAARALALDAGTMLVCLADMPFVTAGHLEALLEGIGGSDAAVTLANGTRSPPALFARRLFTRLTSLDGDSGARDLLRSATPIAASPEMVRDFDTPADFG